MKKQNLPAFLKPFFWSYNFYKLDPENDKKLIIIQTLNYGDLEHWRWINKFYGKGVVRDALQKVASTEFRPQALRLAGLLFNVEKFNYAPRST
ncbi:MAG: hypothetical protein Q8Q86_01770 [Candidatus Daviesbacteria bacterium]|nr:hypothetical protein [Candidatus Daviesbacteria bacterium]